MRRLLALAAIYDGATRAEAAQISDVTRQIVRDWVLRFNEGGPDGLIKRKAPGKPPLLGAPEREALAAVIEAGPVAHLKLLIAKLRHEQFGVSSERGCKLLDQLELQLEERRLTCGVFVRKHDRCTDQDLCKRAWLLIALGFFVS